MVQFSMEKDQINKQRLKQFDFFSNFIAIFHFVFFYKRYSGDPTLLIIVHYIHHPGISPQYKTITKHYIIFVKNMQNYNRKLWHHEDDIIFS